MKRRSDEEISAPLYEYDAAVRSQYGCFAGVDEAGHGPLCGPVCVAACILDPENPVFGINDSKKLTEKKREALFDEIIEKYVEMNIAHPFREGNGRSTRIWLDHILKTEIGKVVDWSKVDKEDYLLAMERIPIKDVEIKVLLKAALSDEINSREVCLSGIDQSFYYEGYTTFKAEDLSKE